MGTLSNIIIMPYNTLTLGAALLTAIAGALVGNLLLMRKMTLVADSMPHIALPGVALGIMFQFNPLLGALLLLSLAVIIIWTIEHKTDLEIDSIIGVLFVTSLAIGSLLVPKEELLESFFGTIEKVTSGEALFAIALALTIICIIQKRYRSLVLTSIAPELAESIGIDRKRSELLFLTLVAFIVAAGIKFVGVLLMSSMLIIPSVTARNMSKTSLEIFFKLSVVFAIISIVGGIVLSGGVGERVGILTALTSATLFGVSLIPALLVNNKNR